MRNLVRILFPVLSVKLRDIDGFWPGVQAINVNINPVGIRAWGVKRFDAADLTEGVSGDAGIESIGCQGLDTAQQSEFA